MYEPSRSRSETPKGVSQLDASAAPTPSMKPRRANEDPVAVHYCKTLKEVQTNHYDVVIVGGGAVGSAIAHRLLKNDPKVRVLVLEKGSFLLPEHVQNLHPQYQKLMAEAIAKPWELAPNTTFDLAPQIPYLGGRALFWSTWIPQPKREQMAKWPEKVLNDLDHGKYWQHAKDFLGASLPDEMGPSFTKFQPELIGRLRKGLGDIPNFLPVKDDSDLLAPLASKDTESELRYRKFSPVPRLLQDATDHGDRMHIVTGCEVRQIQHDQQSRHDKGSKSPCNATELVTAQGDLPLGSAKLVLANGVIEPTGLLQRSFAGVLPKSVGTNLGGHVASWFSVQVPRAGWKEPGDTLQVGCTYLRGRVHGDKQPEKPEEQEKDDHRDFHIHLMGASNPHPENAVEDLYRLIPDSFDQEFLAELSDANNIGFLVHCLGEWRSTPGDQNGSTVSATEDGKTLLALRPSERDLALRKAMDEAAQKLVEEVLFAGKAQDKDQIRYWNPGEPGKPSGWQKELPAGRLKNVLVHESGTLWMGERAKDSATGEDPATDLDPITDLDCRLHTVNNVYVGGAATFPTSGSWNPTLTAVALGQRLADHLAPPKKKEGEAYGEHSR